MGGRVNTEHHRSSWRALSRKLCEMSGTACQGLGVSFDPRNILVIDFGQLGDVVMSLPALAAARARFPTRRTARRV